MSVSLATPRAIAGKMAGAINRCECGECHRPYPAGGVIAFGLSGSDPRWYPSAGEADHAIVGVRYIWPVTDGERVTIDEIVAWLDEQDDEMQQRIEHLEQQRAERRAEREMRESDSGFRTDPYPCEDCAKNGVTHYKNRPADRCDRCGDEPCPIGIAPHDYNRGYGYRD